MSQIMRDADISQALSPVWFQQVILGLAAEWNKSPIDILKMQKGFLGKIEFKTAWARQEFGRAALDEKIAEAEKWLAILSPKEVLV